MGQRLDLQHKLEQILGSEHVYYQPKSSDRVEYPCIVYHLDGMSPIRSDNSIYKEMRYYQVTYINRRPDSPVVDALINFPYSSLSSTMRTEGLYHYVFRIYF